MRNDELPVARNAYLPNSFQDCARRMPVQPVRSFYHLFRRVALQRSRGFAKAAPMIAAITVNPPTLVAWKVRAITTEGK